MENRTRELLLKLENTDAKSIGTEIINESHLLIKNELSKKGIRFFSVGSQFSESIIGNQIFKGVENVELMKSYQEINYIKDIFNERIYSMADEQKRFNPIRERAIEIIRKYQEN